MTAKKIHFDIGIIFVIFFSACVLYTFITGCINVYERNRLEKSGVKVEVTVTDKDYDAVSEDDIYTLSYTYNGTDYTYVDSSHHTLDVGEKMDMYVDPDNPDELILISDNLYLSFVLLILAFGSTYFTDKFRIFKKNIFIAIYIAEAIMIITGIILNTKGLIVSGILLIVVTIFSGRFINKLKNKTVAIK